MNVFFFGVKWHRFSMTVALNCTINSLWPSDSIWRHRNVANIGNGIKPLSEPRLTRKCSRYLYPSHVFENYKFKTTATSLRGQWFKLSVEILRGVWARRRRCWLRAFLLIWINLISACLSNHMSSKMWDKMIYPFPNVNGCTVEVWL